MNNKINDLHNSLNEEINITKLWKIRKVKTKYNFIKWIKDINNKLKKLSISSSKKIKIHQNKTKNFDSFLVEKKLKDINISNDLSKIQKIQLLLKSQKLKIWRSFALFNKKVYISKNFIKKTLISFSFGLILLLTLSFFIELNVKSWYEKILSLKDNPVNIWDSQWLINSSKFNFITAEILFTPFKFIPNNNIKNWYYILEWWKNISILLDNLIQTYISVNNYIETSWWINNIKFTNLLSNLEPNFNKINNLLYNVVLSYDNINTIWVKSLDVKINNAKWKIKKIYKFTNIINNDYNNLLALLWATWERKYLVLFQNNDEIRATWWFIWSLAIVTINKGKIIDFKKDDVYAYEWDINKVYKNKNKAPEWLNQITKTFWLRDANYFVDFWASSKSINFFLKKIWKNVDWIIYINQNTFLDFLKLTWPIQFDEIWKTINEKNFSLLISTLVEAQSFKVWTLWTPKKILFDFAQIFINKLLSEKKYASYLNIILNNFKSRDIVFYSFHPEENNLLWKLWINWKINFNKTLDFNYPVFTSIWWNKTDRYIKLKYEKNINYNVDCSIDTNLKIYRTHYFTKNEEKKVINILDNYPIKDKTRKDILNIQWKWINKQYVRVILPKNIKVKKKKWLKITYNNNFTLVEFYINTRQLETTNYDIDYTILNRSCKDYSYILYKQPWIREYDLKIKDKTNTIKQKWIRKDFKLKE